MSAPEKPAELRTEKALRDLRAAIERAKMALSAVEDEFNAPTAPDNRGALRYALHTRVSDAYQLALTALRAHGLDEGAADLTTRWNQECIAPNKQVTVIQQPNGDLQRAYCPGLSAVETASSLCLAAADLAAKDASAAAKAVEEKANRDGEFEIRKERLAGEREAKGRRQTALITLGTSLATIFVTTLSKPVGTAVETLAHRQTVEEIAWTYRVSPPPRTSGEARLSM